MRASSRSTFSRQEIHLAKTYHVNTFAFSKVDGCGVVPLNDCIFYRITYEWNKDEERWQWKQPKGREIFDLVYETEKLSKKDHDR